MEQNNNIALNNHEISLQLRSKEVSEVTGIIPSWVAIWGTFSIFLLFTLSMWFIFNIHCVQRISGKATIMKRQIAAMPETVSQKYLIQVTVPGIEHNKIKVGQKLTLSFNGENNYLNKLTGIGFLVDKITINKDSSVLWLTGNRDAMKKTWLIILLYLIGFANCELVLDATVFEKVFGSLF